MKGRYREGRYRLPTDVVSEGYLLVAVFRGSTSWLWTHVWEDGTPRAAAGLLDRRTWEQMIPDEPQ